jgi:hypothetical protein
VTPQVIEWESHQISINWVTLALVHAIVHDHYYLKVLTAKSSFISINVLLDISATETAQG